MFRTNLSPRIIALALYHLVVGIVIAVNMKTDHWLMGWDGLYPELNIPLNVVRGLTAGWQEYYGAGLVGGHGFAATLPHTIIIGLLSVIIPQHLLRSVFIFLCYYVGGLGMLLVSHKLLTSVFHDHNPKEKIIWAVSFISSLYYLLNLGTIQTFYVPLEAFTVHFAALPWLTYGLMLTLEQITKKRVMFFCITLLITSIQGFIPAVFAAYAVSLAIITSVFIVFQRFQKSALQKTAIIWICVIATNFYWLAPVGYFSLTQSKDYINAYNNITSTPKFIAKSIQYGSLADVAALKSMLWDSNELGGAILAPWKQHYTHPVIPAISYVLFAFMLYGVFVALRHRRSPLSYGLVLSLLYFFGNIAIDMPPFSWGFQLIQSHSPALVQAFRTTFTKFGTGLSFHYALFLAIGLMAGLQLFQNKRHRIFLITTLMTMTGIILMYAAPVFQGQLIYRKMYVQVPPQYTRLIHEINALPDGKIADFPQDCAEGWYNELWGYFGSGFLWYGVRHPVMARAFDVWSHTNENYYWELSTALRQQDYAAVDRIFDKYGVRYVLYDHNITHCRSQKGFLSSLDFYNHLETDQGYTKQISHTGEKVLPITVYERKNTYPSPVAITNLPNVLPAYPYNDTDRAYASISAYMSDNSKAADVTDPDRLRFSKRGEPLSPTQLDQLTLIPVATVAATSSLSVPCEPQNTAQTVSERVTIGGSIRFITTKGDTCQNITLEGIDTNNAYVLEITSRHLTGEPLLVSVINKGRPAGLDIRLPAHRTFTRSAYLIPPSFQSEVSYNVIITNSSLNQYTSINDLVDIRLSAVVNVHTREIPFISKSPATTPTEVWHPISGLYVVTLPPSDNTTITLNQSYDTGWLAWSEGNLLTQHILVNNWANGWILTQPQEKIILFFMPQLLQYLGVIFLIAPWMIIRRIKT